MTVPEIPNRDRVIRAEALNAATALHAGKGGAAVELVAAYAHGYAHYILDGNRGALIQPMGTCRFGDACRFGGGSA